MKKVIITGANGLIGSHMVDYLLNLPDVVVYASVKNVTKISPFLSKHFINNRFIPILIDLVSDSLVVKAIKDVQPDYFINLGGISNTTFPVEKMHHLIDVNSLGVNRCLTAISKYAPNCRFFSAGSVEQLKPTINSYGLSKAFASLFCDYFRNKGVYAVHVLLSNHESYRRSSQFVTQKVVEKAVDIRNKIDSGQDFEPLQVGNINAIRYWGCALDCVDAIWKLLQVDLDKIKQHKKIIICPNNYCSVSRFISLAFEKVDIKGYWVVDRNNKDIFIDSLTGKPLVVVNEQFYRAGDENYPKISNYSIKSLIDWKPSKKIDQIIEEMVVYKLTH